MKLGCLAILLLLAASLSAVGQETRQNASGPAPSKSDKQASVAKARQLGPEMQRLFNAFLGTWSVTEQIEPSETMPNGGTGEGEEVYRAGPGGVSIIEEAHLKETTGEISGLGIGWWDEKGQGYKTIWCDSENPHGCNLMAHLAKWEGDRFVLRDEFERDGKQFNFKEVFSEITPTSFTQTLYQGEAGKEFKRLLIIHATRSAR